MNMPENTHDKLSKTFVSNIFLYLSFMNAIEVRLRVGSYGFSRLVVDLRGLL